MTLTVRLTAATQPLFSEAAGLFDEYRQHYGANPAPEAVEAWMRDQVISDRARIYVAAGAAEAYGICSVAVVPAALTLRTVWLVRDLYVAPAARRQGVARKLLDKVAEEARTSDAHRLSLQTEAANGRAIELYATRGFALLPDVAVMDQVL
ncbi:GNAT family N-acetyltransferase [Micromonosporaceae bacterium Da 78-11]